ncbi:MAG: DUF2809 domain-containing protein [Prevotella sp.]|nr:DUF2809 domain-containing protein [Alistipes senegalensis]MCM1357577.1 DUF2809 domain-containing protein [Prevotella sp.]MCM1472701.1 DUF2809 domain-containing protein [Muribaculaceae bacterium]
MKKRIPYITGFLILLIVEVLIALFISGGFIRNYMGDVIVVWVVYCFVKIFLVKSNSYLTAIGVMFFAFIVEFLQYIHIVDILGLGNITFFRVLIGTSFSVIDLLCYSVGTAMTIILIFLQSKLKKHFIP